MMIHKVIRKNEDWFYLCNQACYITLSKTTIKNEEVTCKNCLREIAKEKEK